MGFNADAFKNAKYVRRTAEIAVPELAEFFGPEDDKVVTVHNLTGTELSICEEMANQNMIAEVRGLISAFGSGDLDQILSGVKGYIETKVGDTAKTSQEYIKRTYLLMYGCKEFANDRELCIKIREKHPEVMVRLTNKIKALTGMGSEVMGEQRDSGRSPGSKTQ
jgi:hypothetical protein